MKLSRIQLLSVVASIVVVVIGSYLLLRPTPIVKKRRVPTSITQQSHSLTDTQTDSLEEDPQYPNNDFYCLSCDSMLHMTPEAYIDFYDSVTGDNGSTWGMAVPLDQYARCLTQKNQHYVSRVLPTKRQLIDSLSWWLRRVIGNYYYSGGGTIARIRAPYGYIGNEYFLKDFIDTLRHPWNYTYVLDSVEVNIAKAKSNLKTYYDYLDSLSQESSEDRSEIQHNRKESEGQIALIDSVCKQLPSNAGVQLARYLNTMITSANEEDAEGEEGGEH